LRPKKARKSGGVKMTEEIGIGYMYAIKYGSFAVFCILVFISFYLKNY
jgi:hypothetical protein